jgi:hypothetical protein
MVANWEVSAHAWVVPCQNFVLICAWDVPISPILPILPIEKSITYLFSILPFAVPFHDGFKLTHYPIHPPV